MINLDFKTGYMNAGPQSSALYSGKMKTLITVTIPPQIFNLIKDRLPSIFNDVMASLSSYGRHSPTLFSTGGNEKDSSVVEFSVNNPTRTITIELYRPNENVDRATEQAIKDNLREKIGSFRGQSASTSSQYSTSNGEGQANPGGRRKSRKVSKHKHRSRKVKKTRKH